MPTNQSVKAKQVNANGVAYGRRGTVLPLAELLKREVKNEKIEKPNIQPGQAGQSKKREDFTLVKLDCQKVPGDGTSNFAIFFLIFDGYNGSAAAVYSKENLLKDVMSAIPMGLSREDWLLALPRALVAGFAKTDKEFQVKEQSYGTTAIFVEYVILAGVWIYVCVKNRLTAHRIHVFYGGFCF